MLIEKVIIKNFRSYCGVKTFEFTKGLNLVIGANGDGKSTFYDALSWAFSDDDGTIKSKVLPNESQVSAKMFKNLGIGKTEQVRVEVIMSDNGELKSVYKCFNVTKLENGQPEIDGWKHRCKLEGLSSNDEDDFTASYLLNGKYWYPPLVRKYSMFQGEGALKIFDETDNLRNLITLFSDIKDLSPIKEFSKFAETISGRAISRTLNKNKEDREISAKKLEKDISENSLKRAKDKLKELQKRLQLQEGQLDNVEDIMEDIEHVYSLKQRILETKNKISPESKYIEKNSNYVTKLLSNKWILSNFAPVLDQYLDKMNEFSQQKTQFINLYHVQKGERNAQIKANQKAREDLKKQIMGLPWYIPDTKTMESMLKSHRCFVCNREMCEHDDAYKFMQMRLNEALEILNPSTKEEEIVDDIPYPFVSSNIDELHNLGLNLQRRVSRDIMTIPEQFTKFDQEYHAVLAKINDLRAKLSSLEQELQDYIAQKNTGVDLMSLSDSMSEWKSMSKNKEITETEIHKLVDVDIPRLEREVEKARAEYGKAIEKSGKKVGLEDLNEMFNLLGDVLDEIEDTFYQEIMDGIYSIANGYLARLNIDDFTGELQLKRDKSKNKFELGLFDASGSALKAPNTSLKTTMYISALLAISDLSKKKFDNREYPLIFDAPTSSFDAGKDREFYELFSREIDKQVIIVTKSYLLKDVKTGEFILDKEALKRINCPIYRIRKLSGFDKKDVTTIDTQIEKV